MPAPPIGTFIRPVGSYSYCFKVIKVIPPNKESPTEQWWCKRFGLSDDKTTPIKDGHHDVHYLDGLKQVSPDTWKDEWEFETPRWMGCPLYYRRMTVPGFQERLF